EGERVELHNHNGRFMDTLRYGTEAPWPVPPAGAGATLSRRHLRARSADPADWTFSPRPGGTPGAANFPAGAPAPSPVVFSEIPGAAGRPFFVELVNRSPEPVTVGGWIVRSIGGTDGDWRFPEGETIAPGGFRVIASPELGWIPETGDRLVLLSGADGIFLDGITVGAGPKAWSEEDQRWWIPSRATPGQTNDLPHQRDVVINEIQYHPRDLPGETAVIREQALLGVEGRWRFDPPGSDPDAGWQQPGYDDSAWREGAGVFFVEEATLPAPKNTPLTLGRIAYHFRTTVVFDGALEGAQLALRLLVDDGAVIWLNGEEIHRLNLPEGPLTPNTLALTGVGDATFSERLLLSASALRQGTNVLAVEVHQASTGSSDVVFGLEASVIMTERPAVPPRESPESWVELHNRSDQAVDLGGWQFSEGITYAFPVGTVLEGGGFLLVASDAAFLRAQRPGLRILGNFGGRLSRSDDALVLLDAAGNPADAVHYFDAAPWPSLADGGGSTLELREPRSDHRRPESWAASDEVSQSSWRSYSYSGVAQSDGGPTRWNEFLLGLLDAGEAWLDDVSVVESPDTGASRELILNGDFENGATGWRFLGNHRHTAVIADPDQPANHVLRLRASGATEHMHNHLETTLAGNAPVVNGRTYRVQFRARAIAGSPRLNSRLYFNRLARTTRLETPALSGTPGRRNSTWTGNAGPGFHGLDHLPVVPAATEPVTVSVDIADPDGVAEAVLWWNPGGRGWQRSDMVRTLGTRHAGIIPAQAAATVVQFYVEAADARGAHAAFPPAGRDARALYQVRDNQAAITPLHQFRIVMTAADTAFQFAATNVMSNESLGGTLVLDEAEAFYDIRVRLQSSQRGRQDESRVGFSLSFPADRQFHGVHDSLTLDRSGGYSGRGGRQDEIVLRHIINQAGGLPECYNDLARVIFPRALEGRRNGIAQLLTAKYGDEFLDDSFPSGSDGGLFKLELIYFPVSSVANDPQRPKLPQPDEVIGADIANRGEDPEAYRWHFLIENRRDDDDYAPVLRLAQTLSLSGTLLEQRGNEVLDVDQWARAMALKSLSGDADTYAVGYEHNQFIYFRPDTGKALAFPWDMDFAWSRNPSEPLPVGANIGRLLSAPGNLRRFYGHVEDLLNRSFDATYITRWTTHYGRLAGQNYSGVRTYIQQRAASARAQLPRPMPLGITTGGGANPILVNTPYLTLSGVAGTQFRELVLRAPETGLGWTWSTLTNWQHRVPLWLGTNRIEVLAYDYSGQLAASNTVVVVSSAVTGGTDRDGDGLPDGWEVLKGFNPGVADATEDTDDDGWSNGEEYLAGTDPRQSSDGLRCVADAGDEGVTIRFRAQPGRGYTLSRRDSLSLPWSVVTTLPPAATVRDVALPDTAAGGSAAWYRITTP
ncbi:MAG: lamin tail domain-containing protein, partial [Verrucomicrobia bacterium]|nr:lamin tail domain-containing protein [Verrucomicrobiota bacterium]